MLAAYRRSINSQTVQSQVQLRIDYAEKEDAILRAILADLPNSAIDAMQRQTALGAPGTDPASWQNIFTRAIAQANAGRSVNALDNPTGATIANTGDNIALNVNNTFSPITTLPGQYVNAGILGIGAGYPYPLTAVNPLIENDFPLLNNGKTYSVQTGAFGNSGPQLSTVLYPNFNQLIYPDVGFRYKNPGESFVGRRNWWAFSLNAAATDSARTGLARARRNFVFSIYEIPSQAPLSAMGMITIGNLRPTVSIEGKIASQDVTIAAGSNIDNEFASRSNPTFTGGNATIKGRAVTAASFLAGEREAFKVNNPTANFPVSLSTDGGRSAFVPITPPVSFYDRFAVGATPTPWESYTNGASQCAIQITITNPSINPGVPTLGITCLNAAGTRIAANNPSTAFVAAASGNLTISIADIPAYLAANVGASPSLAINNSISVNYLRVNGAPVDESVRGSYRVILDNCDNLTGFTSGFSLVTNFGLYIADDFNIVDIAPADAAAASLPAALTHTPACSLFAPEKFFGSLSFDPTQVTHKGQVGSSGNAANPLRNRSGLGNDLGAIVTQSLSEINHPGNLPPINMMNWLVVLDEIR
ncbi:MAG: hypothetical protein HC845_05200 [Akkermansiaceae bacterium]|nr:hypothetical protein [Akkermansiaceae bacterium]